MRGRRPATIVRNLSIRNGRSPRPIRSSAKKTGPRDVSLIASAISSQTGEHDDDDHDADDEVEHALRHPVGAREDRRAQLEERHALPGHVLAALDQQLGRRAARPSPSRRAGAPRRRSRAAAPPSRPASATISSSSGCAREHPLDLAAGLDLVDEHVVDAAAPRAERRRAGARAAPHRRRSPRGGARRPRSATMPVMRLVARAEQPDHRRDEDAHRRCRGRTS